jgi:glycosyltransferase involved in cell wall biosynthesis
VTRVGVVADFLEERWPSMELAAELTVRALEGGPFPPVLLRPTLPRLGAPHNVERYVGRYAVYPRWLRRTRHGVDLFHVIDHSYAHLVHALPAARTVVTCHDLDAFRSVSGAEREARPPWFRWTMRRVLAGLRAAAHVVCDSRAVRDQLAADGLVPAARSTVVPLPVHPDFGPAPDARADARAAELLGPRAQPELLHVGANVPRKRIPFVLEAAAAVRERRPGARLVRVGGALTTEQRARAERLGLPVAELPPLERPVLAAVYRRAHALLLPSEREGFGWPVLEAMACGTPVVASSALPTVRETGGDAVLYAAPGDARAWADAVDLLLGGAAPPAEALRRAAGFTVAAYASGLAEVYGRVPRGAG